MDLKDRKKFSVLLFIEHPNGEFACPSCHVEFRANEIHLDGHYIVANYRLIRTYGKCSMCLSHTNLSLFNWDGVKYSPDGVIIG